MYRVSKKKKSETGSDVKKVPRVAVTQTAECVE